MQSCRLLGGLLQLDLKGVWPLLRLPTPHKNGLRIKSAVLGVDQGDSECASLQGPGGSHYRSGSHHRDRP
jgi:hypothetical protein